MDNSLLRATAAHTARLDRTLKALQDRIKEQEAVLQKLRASVTPIDPRPSADPKAHLLQLRALTHAYRSVTEEPPYLPPADSPLPALIAIRSTDKCITETEHCISKTEGDLGAIQERLKREKDDLRDATIIQAGLESRIATLEQELIDHTQKTAAEAAKEMVRGIRKKKSYYDGETDKLVKAFNAFIDDHLAILLAAEELGGPVVGELLDVDDAMLEAGFNNQGKLRKPKAKPNDGKRQRTIEEIWGVQQENGGEWNERQAAAAEMRDLTEQLLNNLVEAEGDGPGSYVQLQRESAAARFLVRAKVAQFHPRDASKLRLIDFGRELYD
ncbi:hypothetical protein F5884DRAFT_666428 [Xylogone sp. PMI_703]|nr:hypothetical protein F5884DRAFT_666428 [Xylogone sp. PMI_703]